MAKATRINSTKPRAPKSDPLLWEALAIGRKLGRLRAREAALRAELEGACGRWLKVYRREQERAARKPRVVAALAA